MRASEEDSELSSTLRTTSSTQRLLLKPPQTTSTQESSGREQSTPSETRDSADHAGPSPPQRHFQTDSTLPPRARSTLSSHPRTSLSATPPTRDATEVSLASHGDTLRAPVSPPSLATHTTQERSARSTSATPPARMDQPSRSTSARLAQPRKQLTQLPSRPSSKPVAQLRLDSPSTRTS